MKLDVLTLEDCEQVRQWRNQDLSGLRTVYMLTKEDQEEFHYKLGSMWGETNKYWAVRENIDTNVATTPYSGVWDGYIDKKNDGTCFIEWG